MEQHCSDNRIENLAQPADCCAAVAPVFQEYEAQLKLFILKRVKDKVEAGDILHQLYLKLYKNCEQLQEVKNVRAWLYQITRNAVYDYFRENNRNTPIDEEVDLAEEQQAQRQQELEELVLPLINLLPPEYAEPLRMSELDGISQKELAERLGLSYSGAKSRVQRGRQLLKQKFMECCHLEISRDGELISAQVKADCKPLQE